MFITVVYRLKFSDSVNVSEMLSSDCHCHCCPASVETCFTVLSRPYANAHTHTQRMALGPPPVGSL